MMKLSIRDMTLISMFAVLSIIGAKLSLPVLAIPFTFQFIVSLLTGVVLGGRRAFLAQGLYLAMGLAGLPVFAKGGGIAYVFEPSFGYLIGMALAAGMVGLAVDRIDPDRSRLKSWQIMPIHFAALGLVYGLGVAYMLLVKNLYTGDGLTLVKALQLGILPFLVNDSIYCVAAALIGPRLRRMAPASFFRPAR
jgi:biotin transport system substrate-specific component